MKRTLLNKELVKKKLKKLKSRLEAYNFEYNENSKYSFWAAHAIGHLQGQIYLLEELLEDLEDYSHRIND